jgi:hypothetical protein
VTFSGETNIQQDEEGQGPVGSGVKSLRKDFRGVGWGWEIVVSYTIIRRVEFLIGQNWVSQW